jgi:hypothetical protein
MRCTQYTPHKRCAVHSFIRRLRDKLYTVYAAYEISCTRYMPHTTSAVHGELVPHYPTRLEMLMCGHQGPYTMDPHPLPNRHATAARILGRRNGSYQHVAGAMTSVKPLPYGAALRQHHWYWYRHQHRPPAAAAAAIRLLRSGCCDQAAAIRLLRSGCCDQAAAIRLLRSAPVSCAEAYHDVQSFHATLTLLPRPSIVELVHHIKRGCKNRQRHDSFHVLCCDVSGRTAARTRGEACHFLARDAPRNKLSKEAVRSARKQAHVAKQRARSVKAFYTASAAFDAPQLPWHVLVALV